MLIFNTFLKSHPKELFGPSSNNIPRRVNGKIKLFSGPSLFTISTISKDLVWFNVLLCIQRFDYYLILNIFESIYFVSGSSLINCCGVADLYRKLSLLCWWCGRTRPESPSRLPRPSSPLHSQSKDGAGRRGTDRSGTGGWPAGQLSTRSNCSLGRQGSPNLSIVPSYLPPLESGRGFKFSEFNSIFPI